MSSKKIYNPQNEITIVEVPVSVDSTWQKRYGDNSQLRAGFNIWVETEEVLDYEVKGLVCYKCKAHEPQKLTVPSKFAAWNA